MSTPTTKTELLKTQAHELVKQYITYDVGGRPTHVYTAGVGIGHGGPCTLTEYAYDGISSRVVKRKESYSTWDSSWDL